MRGWWVPEGHLVPPVTNRANYIHWLEDLLALSSPPGARPARACMQTLQQGFSRCQCKVEYLTCCVHWRTQELGAQSVSADVHGIIGWTREPKLSCIQQYKQRCAPACLQI